MMKMNTENLKVLVLWVIIAVGAVLIIGCGTAPDEPPPEAVTYPEEARPEPGTVSAVHFSELIKFLPDAPSGWVGEEPDGMTMTFDEWTWSTVDRRYTELATNTYASITIIDGAYLPIGPWAMWKGFFEYETVDGYLKSTSFKGFPAWEEHSESLRWTPAKGDHTVDNFVLTVGVNGRFMVIISVHDSDRDTLYAFANRVDFQGIAALKQQITLL